MTHAQAIEIIRNGGPTVRLLIQRGGKVPSLPSDGKLINSFFSKASNLLPSSNDFFFGFLKIVYKLSALEFLDALMQQIYGVHV